MAAAQGARVVLAEKSELGGTCVNLGCVPKKLFVYAANFSEEIRLAASFGWTQAVSGCLDWPLLRENKDREISRLNGVYEKTLKDAGVCVVKDEARLVSAGVVHTREEEFKADKILLAMGSAPFMPPISGKELAVCSDDMFHLPVLPRQAVIVGSGYIALEFAGILSAFGVDTTLCYRADLPLRGFDDLVRRHVATEIANRAITLCPNTAPVAIEKTTDDRRLVRFNNNDTITTDLVLMATGRRPQSTGLAALGAVVRDNGTVEVDDNYETAIAGVFAIGDLLQTPALTPVATAEASVFVERHFGGDKTARLDYENIPTAVFSRPPLATVGISEQTAQTRALAFKTYHSVYRPLRRTLGGDEAKTLMKLVVSADTGKVLGAHIVGDDAGEIIQGLAIAIRMGATKDDFDSTVGVHPSNAEEFVAMR